MIEADLEREYGRDLCDLWRGRMTLRKLGVLIDGLPGDSRTQRALAGINPAWDAYTTTNALLGRLVDETALYRWEWERSRMTRTEAIGHRAQPESVLPDEPPVQATGTKASEVAARNDIPVVSPHRLGGFVNGDEN